MKSTIFDLFCPAPGRREARAGLTGFLVIAVLFTVLTLSGTRAHAALTDTRTAWTDFWGANGFVTIYTYQGQMIADEETSADTSNGGAAVQPSSIDLASGTDEQGPGTEATAWYGYYDAGTAYDPDTPSTMNDDYILFRMRLDDDISKSTGFKQYHWNVVIDTDGDGYKEFWVDGDGTYAANGDDWLYVLYNNDNTQEMPDRSTNPEVIIDTFIARNDEDVPALSHTRVVAVGDGTGEYFLDIQVPVIAFDDSDGNQQVYPDTPISFLYSTSASNTDPLQKDWMMDLQEGTYVPGDPVTPGDPIVPDGTPTIYFTDADREEKSYFYYIGDDIYVAVNHPGANTGTTTNETISVTVNDPSTGDDETLTLRESGPNTGFFSNAGGATAPVTSAVTRAWITAVDTYKTTVDEDWTVSYNGSTWSVTGTVSGLQTAQPTVDTEYTSDNGEVTFTLRAGTKQQVPVNGDNVTFTTYAADPLTCSTTSGADDDGDLQVAIGDTIYTNYIVGSDTYTDTAEIVASGVPYLVFTRIDGTPVEYYTLELLTADSDKIYVTVYHSDSNTDGGTQQQITVSLSGNDSESITLEETGNDTGIFRNGNPAEGEDTGLLSKVTDGAPTASEWEDVDLAVITATFNYSSTDYTTTAYFRITLHAGSVRFTNSTGTLDVDAYNTGESVYVEVQDPDFLTIGASFTVIVTNAQGDSETVTVTETSTDSGIWRSGALATADTASTTIDNGTFECQDQNLLTVTYADADDGDLDGGNNNKTDTAYYFGSPTAVGISSFQAYVHNEGVVIQWKTAYEAGTIGFSLFRWDEDAKMYIRVNKKPLPGLLISPQGGTYRYRDRTAEPGEVYSYMLVEINTRGRNRSYGPFEVKGEDKLPPEEEAGIEIIPGYSRKAHEPTAAKIARLKAGQEARKAAKAQKASRRGETLKIVLRETGMYNLDAAEIATLMGLPERRVRDMIRNGVLELSCRGEEVAYTPFDNASTGIVFYGEGIESMYTRDNIYWLRKAKGLRMDVLEGDGPQPASSDQTFIETLHLEEDLFPSPEMFQDPQTDYWFWHLIFSGIPPWDTGSSPFHLEGVADTQGDAILTVRLRGVKDPTLGQNHHATVSLNGTLIGDEEWNGNEEYRADLPFSQDLLTNGENIIEVKGLLDPGMYLNFIFVNSFDLTYERYYQAAGDVLLAGADENEVISISGFGDPDISVFEVTDAAKPKLVTATTVDEVDGGYRASFSSASEDSIYLALTPDTYLTPESVEADIPSDLKRKKNAADYLVITVGELKEAAQTLAAYRQKQGHSTMVVELEDIYDEFNHGVANAEVIKDFLSYAYHTWKTPPRYVVLAGEGTYDYKDNWALGENLVPTLMVGTPYGLAPSDNRFADVEGEDGVPEMAIGRISVVTPEELQAVIGKIISYENTGGRGWAKRVVMVADVPDPAAGDFPADSEDLAAMLPRSYQAIRIYLSDHSLAEARAMILDRINQGALLVHYLGHGGVNGLGTEPLFLTSDVPSLNNGDKLPLLMAMTCVAANFAFPGYDSLGESLQLKEDGGMVSIWGPTGFILNKQSKMLSEAFFLSIFIEREPILGNIVIKAQEDHAARGGTRYTRDSYVLLGDPGLRLK